MRTITLNVLSFSELSNEAQENAKDNMRDFINSIVDYHYQDIKKSYNAFCNELYMGNHKLNKHDLPLTGVTYDYDFIELLEKESDNLFTDAKKLLSKLKRAEKKSIYTNEYLSELFDGNEIEFYSNGKQYKEIK